MKNEKCKKQKRRLSKDERGVSPVVGVIMMVAITVVIAAVVAAFAYGIIGGVQKAPNAALIVEDAVIDSHNISIIHHGGDKIANAFDGSYNGSAADMTLLWDNMEIRFNGDPGGNSTISLNGKAINTTSNVTQRWGTTAFSPGDQLDIDWTLATKPSGLTSWNLTTDDSLGIVYTPSRDVLQRIVVV